MGVPTPWMGGSFPRENPHLSRDDQWGRLRSLPLGDHQIPGVDLVDPGVSPKGMGQMAKDGQGVD